MERSNDNLNFARTGIVLKWPWIWAKAKARLLNKNQIRRTRATEKHPEIMLRICITVPSTSSLSRLLSMATKSQEFFDKGQLSRRTWAWIMYLRIWKDDKWQRWVEHVSKAKRHNALKNKLQHTLNAYSEQHKYITFPHVFTTNHIMHLPTATLSIDQSNLSPGFLNFQQTEAITWLWRWLPHRLSKRQSPTTVSLRAPTTQMIFFNQGISRLGSNHLLINLEVELSPGQTDSQVVASSGKLNLQRDLRWVAKR